jgi:16S rRNA A1518/A1519 N6-dimethyltransferase RsmA/KsgA/DIM1 with predicted DNA glycosylase/AP lyase activity
MVRDEYASEVRLAARKAAHALGDGPDARQIAVEAIAEGKPRRVLEVGPGEGELAERMQNELGCDVVAIDQSELPQFEGALMVRRAPVVLVAHKP